MPYCNRLLGRCIFGIEQHRDLIDETGAYTLIQNVFTLSFLEIKSTATNHPHRQYLILSANGSNLGVEPGAEHRSGSKVVDLHITSNSAATFKMGCTFLIVARR